MKQNTKPTVYKKGDRVVINETSPFYTAVGKAGIIKANIGKSWYTVDVEGIMGGLIHATSEMSYCKSTLIRKYVEAIG